MHLLKLKEGIRRHANDLLDAMHSARFNDVKRYAVREKLKYIV